VVSWAFLDFELARPIGRYQQKENILTKKDKQRRLKGSIHRQFVKNEPRLKDGAGLSKQALWRTSRVCHYADNLSVLACRIPQVPPKVGRTRPLMM